MKTQTTENGNGKTQHTVVWTARQHPLTYLTVADLVGLHNYLRDEIDILSNCESPSERLKIAQQQCILVEQEIDKRRTMLFGGE